MAGWLWEKTALKDPCRGEVNWLVHLQQGDCSLIVVLLFFSSGLQIPRSYLSLQEAVLAEQCRRSQNDDVQYLTDRQIELIIEQTPGNDIKDYEDLQTGKSEQTSNFLEINV